MRRLPKKLTARKRARDGAASFFITAVGWGIYVLEAQHGIAVIWITVGTVLISFVLAVLWAALIKDVQGAFGIAAFLVAAQGAIIFAFFNYHPIHSAGRIA